MHDRRGSPGLRRAKVAPHPEQSEADYRLALKWREEWRQDKQAAEFQRESPMAPAKPVSPKDDGARRTKFAKAIARAELGRAYWDERRERGPGNA
jgi:hypothetical protein